MLRAAFVVAPARAPPCRPQTLPRCTPRRPRAPPPPARLVRTRCCARDAQHQPQPRHEPVEDGVTLPQVAPDTLAQQSEWLAQQLTSWLDAEWRQSEPQRIHERIGSRVGQVYLTQRLEGEHDLTNVMLAIGADLERMDLSAAFVGAWNVANTAAELLLQNCAGERLAMPNAVRGPGAVTWASYNEHTKELRREALVREVGDMAAAPSLMDRFEKMKFLKDVLDGSASKQMIDGAVAAAVGFRFDARSGAWDGAAVSDEHFAQFGDQPPDVLGDEHDAHMGDTLEYLQRQLGLEDDESGELAKSLHMIVETLHGTELTNIQSADDSDHSFRKRAIVAKWLHVRGAF